ncbi:MAG: DMT family transporter [Planctomycetota bacterium]
MNPSTAGLTVVALVAFAANSLLGRMALGNSLQDPVSFTAVRLLAGAIALLCLNAWFGEGNKGAGESPSPKKQVKDQWLPALWLFGYALAFSLAYVTLSAATGALVLFGFVQLTMMLAALMRGERLSAIRWLGFATAVVGVVYLFLPGLTSPDPIGAMLMSAAGVAWGLYSIAGRGVRDPIAMTTRNFVFSLPLALLGPLLAFRQIDVTALGLLLACVSGAVTSGGGYVVWYKVLPSLTTSQASVLQLSVPVIAGIGGILFLVESLTARLGIASLLILGGIAISIRSR